MAAATIIVGCSNRKFTQKARRKIFEQKFSTFYIAQSFIAKNRTLEPMKNYYGQIDYVNCALIRVKDERQRGLKLSPKGEAV